MAEAQARSRDGRQQRLRHAARRAMERRGSGLRALGGGEMQGTGKGGGCPVREGREAGLGRGGSQEDQERGGFNGAWAAGES